MTAATGQHFIGKFEIVGVMNPGTVNEEHQILAAGYGGELVQYLNNDGEVVMNPNGDMWSPEDCIEHHSQNFDEVHVENAGARF